MQHVIFVVDFLHLFIKHLSNATLRTILAYQRSVLKRLEMLFEHFLFVVFALHRTKSLIWETLILLLSAQNIYIMCHMSCVSVSRVICHVSNVACHLSRTSTATPTDPPTANFPTMNSKGVCKDQN